MPTEPPTETARHFLSRRLIQRVVAANGLAEIFFQSQSWAGYHLACDSWHSAYWAWVDAETFDQSRQQWKEFQFNWGNASPTDIVAKIRAAGFELPVDKDGESKWIQELFRQEAFQSHAVFQLAMNGPEASDASTFDLFADDIFVASKVGDVAYNTELAKQKQRKPNKNKGDRRLKPQLLLYWIPACLWAFTNEGVAAFLNDLYPRSGEPYQGQVISNAHRSLRLYHAPRPLYWGLTGFPSSLVPL